MLILGAILRGVSWGPHQPSHFYTQVFWGLGIPREFPILLSCCLWGTGDQYHLSFDSKRFKLVAFPCWPSRSPSDLPESGKTQREWVGVKGRGWESGHAVG